MPLRRTAHAVYHQILLERLSSRDLEGRPYSNRLGRKIHLILVQKAAKACYSELLQHVKAVSFAQEKCREIRRRLSETMAKGQQVWRDVWMLPTS